jgi:phospholipid/cholesterol/gamma-HCH transport system ATP-binding protein
VPAESERLASREVDGARRLPVISVRGLRTAFGDHVVHDQLDLDVMPGEILSLVGGSGSGKTALLRQIIGLNRPAAGQVRVLGRDLRTLTQGEFLKLSRRWGILFQAGALFSALPVFENVALPLRELRHLPDDLIASVVMRRLASVGLTAQDAGKYPADLSGGMVKRVALARALALDPSLLFLDEPTAGLDPQRSDEFVALVRALHRQLGFTMVMVTHDLDTLLALSSRVAVLAEKRVIACDTVANLLRVQHPFIREFFLGERGRRALEALNGKP